MHFDNAKAAAGYCCSLCLERQRNSKLVSCTAAGRIGTGEFALALDAIVTKNATMHTGENFGLCNCEGTRAAERVLDEPVPNYQLLVCPDIIQNARQLEQIVLARLHKEKYATANA
jgi:hypothetical protein